MYFELEKKYPEDDIVLVKADTFVEIRSAYRNYFSDTNEFLRLVREGCDVLSNPKSKKRPGRTRSWRQCVTSKMRTVIASSVRLQYKNWVQTTNGGCPKFKFCVALKRSSRLLSTASANPQILGSALWFIEPENVNIKGT
jgi:hypothetical protein